MHPKTEILPTRKAVEKILKAGWVGQIKIHGHRAQIHISADPEHETLAYNRQGRLHKKLLPPQIIRELRRIFDLNDGWTVLDAEWLKPENKLFLFDVLKFDGILLRKLSYRERWKHLPRAYLSPHVTTLSLLTSVEKCMDALATTDSHIEGLVFKSIDSKGFEDSAIVRCRKARSALG